MYRLISGYIYSEVNVKGRLDIEENMCFGYDAGLIYHFSSTSLYLPAQLLCKETGLYRELEGDLKTVAKLVKFRLQSYCTAVAD